MIGIHSDWFYHEEEIHRIYIAHPYIHKLVITLGILYGQTQR